MVVFDATMMLLFMRPDVGAPIDQKTGKPVEDPEGRIGSFIKRLEKDRTKIIIPTPALSELLVRAGSDAPKLINIIQKQSVFRIVPFDTIATIETAMLARQALGQWR